MMSEKNEIIVDIHGNPTGLVTAANKASQALKQMQTQAHTTSVSTIAGGVALGNMYTQLAEKVLHFAKDFIGEYAEIGKEVIKLQRITGGGAEDMSKLRFAAEEMGVPIQLLTRSFRVLSSHLVANDKNVQQLGLSYKDASGNIKPAIQMLGEVADKLNAIDDPYKRNAMGQKLLSRGYQEMIPLLKLGSHGMKELAGEAEKMGLVLSEKNVADIKKYTMSKREMHAAISGVSVALGKVLLPAMTSYITALTNGILKIINFVKEHKGLQTALKIAAGVVGALTVAFLANIAAEKLKAFWDGVVTVSTAAYEAATILAIGVTEGFTGVMAALNIIMEANPIGLVVAAVVLLIGAFIAAMKSSETLRNVFVKVMTVLGAVFGALVFVAVEAFKNIIDAFTLTVRLLAKGASWLGGIFHIGWLKSAGDAVNNFIVGTDNALDNFAKSALKNGAKIGKNIGTGISDGIKNLKMPSLAPKLPGADGADVTDPTLDTGGGGGKGGNLKKQIAAAKKVAEQARDKLVDAAKAQVEAMKDIAKAVKKEQAALVDAANAAKDATYDMWDGIVNNARDAMDAAVNAAQTAAGKLADAARSVGEAISRGMDISSLFKDSYAQYLGGGAFLDLFRKRLNDAKQFVIDLKQLGAKGLAPDLLAQIASAGPSEGLAVAEMLLRDQGTLDELNKLQAELTSVSAEGGQFVGNALYGAEVATTAANATSATGTYNTAVANAAAAKAAADAAVAAAEAAQTAANDQAAANIDTAQAKVAAIQNIAINVVSPASAQAIADQVAWAVQTNSPTVTIGKTTGAQVTSPTYTKVTTPTTTNVKVGAY